jgi:hypothetical protein
MNMNSLSKSLRDLHVEFPNDSRTSELKNKIPRSATPYMDRMFSYDLDHKLHDSPYSIPFRRTFLRQLSKPSVFTPRLTIQQSRLESLPNELILNIVNFLDIASLMRFAATNSCLRHLVMDMPQVQLVKSHATTILALSRMLRAGTAKHFTLHHFVDTLSTSSCSICEDHATFAPWICLIDCQRICGKCIQLDQSSIRLQQSMAMKCFGIIQDDMMGKMGTASAILHPQILPPVPQPRNQALVRHSSKVNIISLRSMLNLSLKKHAITGGAKYVKKLIEDYIWEHDPELLSSGKRTAITNACDVMGLSDVIQKEWNKQVPSQDWVLTAYVPYIYPGMFPLRFETGVLCEGCQRDAFHAGSPLARSAARRAAEDAYLPSQYQVHFEMCETAWSISNGNRLKMLDENSLRDSMSNRAPNRFMNIIRGFDFDRTPSEVTKAVEHFLQQINNMTDRREQCRTAAIWQTASPPVGR